MLQFITQHTDRYSHVESARLALMGGCRWIQLRMKNSMLEEVERVAKEVKSLCAEYNAIFILDDYVEIAHKVHADGVHLGKNDMPVRDARRYLGDSFIIGGTANTFEDVKRLSQDGVDYIGCGPFRFTTTKDNLSPILGERGYREIITSMQQEGIELPLVAIGGISREDIPLLLSIGVNGIALSGSVLRADNPINEMALVLRQFP